MSRFISVVLPARVSPTIATVLPVSGTWILTQTDQRTHLHGILRACKSETLRSRLMLCLAYDGALRREELVSLEIGDADPAWSLIHLRVETTKSQRTRMVAFGST
jgi:integrase